LVAFTRLIGVDPDVAPNGDFHPDQSKLQPQLHWARFIRQIDSCSVPEVHASKAAWQSLRQFPVTLLEVSDIISPLIYLKLNLKPRMGNRAVCQPDNIKNNHQQVRGKKIEGLNIKCPTSNIEHPTSNTK
jgi:hypothetical protein